MLKDGTWCNYLGGSKREKICRKEPGVPMGDLSGEHAGTVPAERAERSLGIKSSGGTEKKGRGGA